MDRRTFLQRTAAGMTAALFPYGAAHAQATPPPSREGVYTDRQTYRAGVDPVNVHVSLLDFATVNIRIFQRDRLPSQVLVAEHDVPVDDTQVTEYPDIPSGGVGVYGPQFPARLTLDTTGWEPGIYMLLIPQTALREENRFNYSGGSSLPFLSQNFICYFVVTAAIPTSHSNILWLHDGCTGMAYGAFGEESIYPGLVDPVRTVTALRPGNDRAAAVSVDPVRKFKSDGYVFEFMDALVYGNLPGPTNHELVVVCGQFEYLSNGFVSNLKAQVDAGRNVLAAANEFAIFRTRVDPASTSLTTYKYDGFTSDPIGPPDLAGVGMKNPDGIYENEIAGLNLWSAGNTGFTDQDMQVTHSGDLGWILEGTGFTDTIPGYINGFSMGNRGILSGGSFQFLDQTITRTPADTVAWAAMPASNARDWVAGDPFSHSSLWPSDPDAHAACTVRQTSQGARVVGMAQDRQIWRLINTPSYARIAENLLAWVSQDGPASLPAVPTFSPLAVVALAGGLVGTANRLAKQAEGTDTNRDDTQRAEADAPCSRSHPQKSSRIQSDEEPRIGDSSCVFATTDIRHSDK